MRKHESSGTGNGEGAIGLRELVRKMVQRDVLHSCASGASASGWMVLVLDSEASLVLTPVLGMYDLMQERVSLVESLEKRRQPFREMDVIYVAAANDKSVRAIAADWQGQRHAPYAEAHIFFLSPLNESQMDKLAGTPELASRLKSLAELNLHFLAVEAQAYTLASARSFGLGRSTGLGEAEMNAARKLATVCATLGEMRPRIRFRAGNNRARALGACVLDSLRSSDQNDGGATLLILDRVDDPLTPLLHEYTYQALIQDMLDVEGEARDRVRYAKATKAGETVDDVAILNENDALWVEMRHKHVAKVIDALRARLSDFFQTNAAAATLARGAGADLSLGDMASALKKLPEFQAASAALNKHMTIAHECLSRFHTASLLETSQLEQTLVTGKDDDGAQCLPSKLLDDVAACVARAHGTNHAVRLVACYFVAKNGRVSEAERSKLLSALQPSSTQQDALLQLARLVAAAAGVPLASDAAELEARAKVHLAGAQQSKRKKKSAASFASLKSALRTAARGGFLSSSSALQQDDDDDDVAASRYTPPVKPILDALAQDRLPEDLYPTLGGASADPKPRAVQAQSVRNRKHAPNAKKTFAGPKLIVCILGGAAFSEVRCAYEVADATHRRIIFGATTLLTPDIFLTDLAQA